MVVKFGLRDRCSAEKCDIEAIMAIEQKVKVTELRPGMLLFKPTHREGVQDALFGPQAFCKGRKPKQRKVKRGYEGKGQ